MGVIVKPWKRGGKVRLYVRDATSGQDIGFVDPDQGTGKVFLLDQATEFVMALHRYNIPRETTIAIVAESAPKENVDLSQNQPGAAAQEKADELIKGMNKYHAEIIQSLGYGSVDQTWIQGAEGERKVGNALERRLSDDWHVLHSVPIGDEGSDIDHLVIGPGGVFSINTKTHPGSSVTCVENRVRVEGSTVKKYQPYAKKSRFEANRSSKLLTQAVGFRVPVLGVLAYIAAEVEVMSNPKDGKVVHLNADHLCSWIARQDRILAPKAVEMIYTKARWSDTWMVRK